MSSGIKVMVLAVIVGIGSGFFGQFTGALSGQDPTLTSAMTVVLATLALLGLSIFGPGIASGLVSGAPQLGAGAAVGTVAAFAGAAALAGTGGREAARLLTSGGMAALKAGTSLSAGAATAYGLGKATSSASGMAGVGAGLAGVAKAAAGAARGAASSSSAGFAEDIAAGRRAAWRYTGGTQTNSTPSSPSRGPDPSGAAEGGGGSSASPPAWARRLRDQQRLRGHAQNITQAIREGERPTQGANPDLDP
jgi:type IV secretion system protein TrbL